MAIGYPEFADISDRAQEGGSDSELFSDSFGAWVERHGVTLGEFDQSINSFNATIDLNKLKPAIIGLFVEYTISARERIEHFL
jgi:hypothetical protein